MLKKCRSEVLFEVKEESLSLPTVNKEDWKLETMKSQDYIDNGEKFLEKVVYEK